MLIKMSFQYWRHHRKRLLTFMLSLVLGVSALCCTALLIRSEKSAVYEEELRLLGDYDRAAFNISCDTAKKIRQDGEVEAVAVQYELGYVQNVGGAKFYAAAFEDKKSEEIYHMTCTRGRYPEKDDEVAMDISTAKSFGIKPYPNEKVTLPLFSADGRHLADKEFTLCGVYEAAANNEAGWLRYPYGKEYNMPSVYLHISLNEIFKSSIVSAFIQLEQSQQSTVKDGGSGLYDRIMGYAEETMIWEPYVNGRAAARLYVMGTDTLDGTDDLSAVNDALENDDTVRDFYSGILMPILTVIIFIIVILSVVGITRNIIKDKQENFAVLRSLGLSQTHLRLYILCDFTATALICIAVGLALGSLAHIGIIKLLCGLFDLKLNTGFSCTKYVEIVTFDPFVLSSAAMILCVEFAVAVAMFGIKDKTPIELFGEGRLCRRRLRTNKPAGKYKGWKRLLVRRIKLKNGRIAVVSILVMGVALFGYTYFCALSDKANNELKWEKEQSGLAYWDYSAEIASPSSRIYTFGIENRHDQGVSRSDYEKLRSQPYIKDSFGRIVNNSTRLTFAKDGLDDKALKALEDYDAKQFTKVDISRASELELAEKDAENALVEKVGYDKTDRIYACPTVALFDDSLEKLKEYVYSGEINTDRLRDGSEVLLVMTKTSRDKFIGLFSVGDRLPLSDIILNEREDSLDFSHLDKSQLGEPIYRKNVRTDDGYAVELTSYALGRRKDLDVKIGAVVVLDTDEAKQYMTYAGNGSYGMNVFCGIDAFAAWGLDDRSLTDVTVKLTSDSAVDKADEYWYSIMSGAKGMVSHSTAEISARMNRGARRIMSVYYCMMIILTLTAVVTIAISLYTDIRMRSSKFAMLRACGMSTGKILFLILRQNIVYPVVGAVFSIVPVAVCQRFLDWILNMVRTDEMWHERNTWIDEIPYYYNLYDYHIVRTAAVIFAVYLALMLLVTLPQVQFIRKQSIALEIEKSSF